MRFINFSLLLTSVALIAGCANPDQAYVQKSHQVKPLQMPAGVNLKNEQNYYPLPSTAKSAAAVTPPPLTPPGCNLQRFEKKHPPKNVSAANASAISIAKWSQSKAGEPILVLLEKQNKAWDSVGKALNATGYQILDRDPSMSSYYILDTKSTGNQITEKTPIYRVYVKADKETSKIILLSEKNKSVSAGVAKQILQSLEQHLV